MKAFGYVRGDLVEIPMHLPDPSFSDDDIKPLKPALIVLRPPIAANENPRKPSRSNGEPGSSPIRIVSYAGVLGRLLGAFIKATRPEYQIHSVGSTEALISHLSTHGADVIFVMNLLDGALHELKLNSSFSRIPTVVIETTSWNWSDDIKEKYLDWGADAVLFTPFSLTTLSATLDLFLPPYKPTADE